MEITPELPPARGHPEDQDRVRRAMDGAIGPRRHGLFTLEPRVCSPGGMTVRVQVLLGTPDARRPSHPLDVFLNITERTPAEERHVSEERRPAVMDDSTAIAWTMRGVTPTRTTPSASSGMPGTRRPSSTSGRWKALNISAASTGKC